MGYSADSAFIWLREFLLSRCIANMNENFVGDIDKVLIFIRILLGGWDTFMRGYNTSRLPGEQYH